MPIMSESGNLLVTSGGDLATDCGGAAECNCDDVADCLAEDTELTLTLSGLCGDLNGTWTLYQGLGYGYGCNAAGGVPGIVACWSARVGYFDVCVGCGRTSEDDGWFVYAIDVYAWPKCEAAAECQPFDCSSLDGPTGSGTITDNQGNVGSYTLEQA